MIVPFRRRLQPVHVVCCGALVRLGHFAPIRRRASDAIRAKRACRATIEILKVNLLNRCCASRLTAPSYWPIEGGLASYGADNIELYCRARSYVDRIL